MKKNIFFLLLVLTASTAVSQDDYTPKTIFSIVPQYIINGGIRVDIEQQIKPGHYLQICPQFYFNQGKNEAFTTNNNTYQNILGSGLNLYHKIFLLNDFPRNGLYFSYGVLYNYFSLDYADTSADIHKVGLDLLMGFQALESEILSIDLYGGVGTRYSDMDPDNGSSARFNNTYWGFNFTGNLLVVGVRFGFVLDKL